MDEKQFSYPLELGVSMFSGRHALKVNAYQELYMQAVEPHLMNIGMDEAKLMAELDVAWVLIALTMEPKRPIRPGDRLHAKTWNSTEKARLLFRREIAFYDENEEIVLTGATFSALHISANFSPIAASTKSWFARAVYSCTISSTVISRPAAFA